MKLFVILFIFQVDLVLKSILDDKVAAILKSMAAMQQQINSLPAVVQEYR
jgi:hypothetical protein